MTTRHFDRRAQDLGNVLLLEHVNVRVPDQQLATLYYIAGLGLTRDPYLMVSVDNMWANAGQTQFHLPTGAPQVVRGPVELVMQDWDALPARLEAVHARLDGTAFGYQLGDKRVTTTCPWGNPVHLVPPGPAFPDVAIGIVRVEVPVGAGDADGVARFYRTVLRAPAAVADERGAPAAHVTVGPGQTLVFRESAEVTRPYDGHHVAVYISDFSGPHAWLAERGLVTEESNPYQYRFQRIVDPDTGRLIVELEHEVRSATHPMYGRPLVNRNPAQRQPTYQRGRDAFVPGLL
jgi:hypothetical protein